MATKRKKATNTDLDGDDAAEPLSFLERLTNLRRDVKDRSAITELLDILIDMNDGDSVELAEEIEAERREAAEADASASTAGDEPEASAEPLAGEPAPV